MSVYFVYFPHFVCCCFSRVFAACAIILGPFFDGNDFKFYSIQHGMDGMQTAHISACDDVIYTFFGGYCLCLCFHSSRFELSCNSNLLLIILFEMQLKLNLKIEINFEIFNFLKVSFPCTHTFNHSTLSWSEDFFNYRFIICKIK